jgi:hypothetical protein
MNRDQFSESSSLFSFFSFVLGFDTFGIGSFSGLGNAEQKGAAMLPRKIVRHHCPHTPRVLKRAILEMRGSPLESIRNSKDCILEQKNSSMNVNFVSRLVTPITNRSKYQLFQWPIFVTSFLSHLVYLETTM